MDPLETIATRRSIRRYTPEGVSDSDVTTILDAAMASPSAGNEAPWHFIVLRERGSMESIMRVHPYSRMLIHAPVAIIVCADLSLERHEGFWVQDCSAATMSMLLAAHALGLGAVWLGVHPDAGREAGVREAFELPEGIVPLSIVSIGHPDETKPPSERYDEGRVHQEKW